MQAEERNAHGSSMGGEVVGRCKTNKWMHSNTSTWKRRRESLKIEARLSALIIDLGYQNWHLVLVLLFL